MSDSWFYDLFIDEAKAALESHSGGSGGGSGGGNSEEWIGDGNTHIWITLHDGRTSPMLGVCPNGTVTVDWGDGTTPDTLTGTSTSTVKFTPNHNYAKSGDYVITLTVDGEMGIVGYVSYSRLLASNASFNNNNFAYTPAIRKIEIGSAVTSIGDYAFYYCYALESISISDSVKSIGKQAFYCCYSLASVAIPNSVTSIGSNAFEKCYSLVSVVIPNSVTSIGNESFNNCSALASVAIPNSVTSIGTSMFDYCNSLKSVVIPNSVTSIGSYAFTACYALASVAIPNSVTSIGSNAFKNCYALTSIVIPSSVTSIGNDAFRECRGIRYYDFTKHTAVPALGNTYVFANNASDYEIRVPAVLYDEWIAATNWTAFADKIVAV